MLSNSPLLSTGQCGRCSLLTQTHVITSLKIYHTINFGFSYYCLSFSLPFTLTPWRVTVCRVFQNQWGFQVPGISVKRADYFNSGYSWKNLNELAHEISTYIILLLETMSSPNRRFGYQIPDMFVCMCVCVCMHACMYVYACKHVCM
jgi:hypothetical protein